MYIQFKLKKKYLLNSRGGGDNFPALDRLVTSKENPSECSSFCKSLLFNVLQKIQPYKSPRGRAVPTRLNIREQTVLRTDSTQILVCQEGSVRGHTGVKQQSGGRIQEVYRAYTTSLYTMRRATASGVWYIFKVFNYIIYLC